MNFIKMINSWLSPVVIVFKDVNLFLWKEKIVLRRIGLHFGFLGVAELILSILGTKAKYSQGSDNWVDQCIIVMKQW